MTCNHQLRNALNYIYSQSEREKKYKITINRGEKLNIIDN